jgi:hypothetical protein
MALTIEGFIIVEWLLAAFGWGDAWQGALLGQSLAEPVAVVTAVAEQCSGLWQARQ